MKLENRRSVSDLMKDDLTCGKILFCSLISAYVNERVTKSIA